MAFGLNDLIKCLETGDNLDIGYHRVFGGQILAQMIVAAANASPDKVVKSINVLFPREGDTSKRMEYRVDKLQDGRTFGTTSIVATQDEKVISTATVSLHVLEDATMHRSDAIPPGVGTPTQADELDNGMIPWELRVVGGVDLAAKEKGPAEYQMWMRATAAAGQPLAVQQALLAHATDLTVIGTALRPFEGVSQADSTVTLHTAVTSHSLWYHQPFDLSDWLLLSQSSPVVAGGRAYGRGDVWASSGEIVASFAQESMIRAL
ncbi:MAG TPA: acyl-CoA thioesterase domain-containing protein [Acidimicrobiales bacterium]|nr:acyl-CoA thioesterase domain-containing protein [Acidimicrobiales bacterium]